MRAVTVIPPCALTRSRQMSYPTLVRAPSFDWFPVSDMGAPSTRSSPTFGCSGDRPTLQAARATAISSPPDAWRKVGRLARDGPPPPLTVAENVSFAARIAGASLRDSGRLVAMVLRATGLEYHAATQVDRLSAWEGRCTALARALARVPVLVIADEPTAGLDPVTAGAILVLLREVAASGVAVLPASLRWLR